jgi:hypothetical protein
MWCYLNFVYVSLKASLFLSIEEFTWGRLSNIPGIVKLLEPPGKARGLPMIN